MRDFNKIKNVEILIVEDEQDLSRLLSYHLEKESFQTRGVRSAEEALEHLALFHPQLMVLDLMLPGMSGLELCKRIRENPKTKDILILMLTAKSKKEDIVKGLDCGADDYVAKPFDIREVVARIKAILRRMDMNPSPFSYRALKVDWERHKIYFNQNEIYLTITEFKILRALIENQGRVLTRQRLIDFAVDGAVIERTIDVHMAALRKKLGPAYIETIRGIGYRFQDTTE